MEKQNKTKLIEYFKKGGRIRVLNPSHKYYGIDRKAEKIQTNSLKFEGGSWIYFKDIKNDLIFSQGFKAGFDDDLIEYAFMDMELVKEVGLLK